MRIDRFWVVTRPTSDSTLIDVRWEADLRELLLAIKGGLDAEGIVGLYTEAAEADREAGRLLVERDAKRGEEAARFATLPLPERIKSLLWDVIVDPRFRDRAKATLDALSEQDQRPGAADSDPCPEGR